MRKTYPFNKPPKVRASNATGRLLANPKTSILSPVPAKPVSRTGLRPILSLSHPQNMLARNSAIAKAEVTMPAYIEICFSLSVILKESTINHMYGNMPKDHGQTLLGFQKIVYYHGCAAGIDHIWDVP